MIKTNIKKRIVNLLVLFAIIIASIPILPLDAFAKEPSLLDEYNEINSELIETGYLDGSSKVIWYDNFFDAYNHPVMRVGQHAELKSVWIPIYGWTTHGCTITSYGCTQRKDGKWATAYQNDYDNQYYLVDAYE